MKINREIYDINKQLQDLDISLPEIQPWAVDGFNNPNLFRKGRNLSVMNKTQHPMRTMHPPGVGDSGEHFRRFSTRDVTAATPVL